MTQVGEETQSTPPSGVYSAMWRGAAQIKPGGLEAGVHKLQQGWCRYKGSQAAVQTSVWLRSESPAAARHQDVQTAAALGSLSPPSLARPPSLPHTPSTLDRMVCLSPPVSQGLAAWTGGLGPGGPGAHSLPAGPQLGLAHSLTMTTGSPGPAVRKYSSSLSDVVASHFNTSNASCPLTPPISPFTRAWNSIEQRRAGTWTAQVPLESPSLAAPWASSSLKSDTVHTSLFPSTQSCPPQPSQGMQEMRSMDSESWHNGQPLRLTKPSTSMVHQDSGRGSWLEAMSLTSGGCASLPTPGRTAGQHEVHKITPDLAPSSDLDRLLEEALHPGPREKTQDIDMVPYSLSPSFATAPAMLMQDASYPQRKPRLAERVVMAIVSAPAMFAQPCGINKLLSPPFVVRVGVISPLPSQIKATVAAYVLSKEQLQCLEKWQPSQQLAADTLGGGVVTAGIVCQGPNNPKLPQPAPGKHVGVTDFVFSDLKFQSSSRMKPVWVVFALTLPTDDVLFIHYAVPTIVMSRQCDQQSKAAIILRSQMPSAKKRLRADQEPEAEADAASSPGSAFRSAWSAPAPSSTSAQTKLMRTEELTWLVGPSPASRMTPPAVHPRPSLPLPTAASAEPQSPDSAASGSSVQAADWPWCSTTTYEHWRRAVTHLLATYTPQRPLGPADWARLQQLAGYPQPGDGAELPSHRWAAFGQWFLSFMQLFSFYDTLWASTNPTAICGFGVDQPTAEESLRKEPSGTFLIRPSLSLRKTLVLSLVLHGGIFHMALEAPQLEARSLEVWVRDVREATHLLDLPSGQRFPKEQVFLRHYRRLDSPSSSGILGQQSA